MARIKLKENNYEQFINRRQADNEHRYYSRGGEVKTGATFNGKPVYRKWVSGTQGTGNEWKTISTGIVNGANAHIVDGWTNGTNGNNYPLNFFISTSEWSYAGVNESGATVYLNHYEGYIIGRTAYVCIEYTKTTD